ncbi:MAG: cellulase family glycosylhydrolase [Tenericutes bacterium]|nr:cellulase family glycosylhydrolase [Mycoplasmatota bacterium]
MIDKIRGVNLGGWLVLEKWMTPELYAGFDEAHDEYNLLLKLEDSRQAILKKHRDTFITEKDFEWMSEYGLNVLRLPIGHWLFEDKYPYINSLEYVKKAFFWAEKYGMKILLNVHAAPGCQNAFDNGGLSGICDWQKYDNIDKTLVFIEQMTNYFKEEKSLYGIQVLNEPRWDIDISIIQEFYLNSYRIIRKYLNDDYVIVFHDAFRLNQWKEFFTSNDFTNVILDTHMYQVFSYNDKRRIPVEVLEKTSILRYRELEKIDFVDIVIGEWSLGVHKFALDQITDDFMRESFYTAVGHNLLTTYETTKGWFFWNYNLSEESTKKRIGWSFRDVVEKGYLPKKIKGDKR